MPPRIQTKLVTNALLHPHSTPGALLTPTCTPCQRSTRSFTSTPASQTRLREKMFEWLNGDGQEFKSHTPGSPNYVTKLTERRQGGQGDGRVHRPFPLNPYFTSESILSEELRNEIHRLVMVEKRSVREVSVKMGVDMRRIGAVVRLVELEKRWKAEKKPLALPYARAIHEMVPVTPLEKNPGEAQPTHESINDLPTHKLTEAQIFYPVSESRQFNRVDAGRVFSGAMALPHSEAEYINKNPTEAILRTTEKPSRIERVGKGDDEHQVLQPADARIPHPQLVAHYRDRNELPNEKAEWGKRYQERLDRDQRVRAERRQKRIRSEEERTLKVRPENSKFEFRFEDVTFSKETAGADGRGTKAPGMRYGVPNYDRSKGNVRIPTRVDV